MNDTDKSHDFLFNIVVIGDPSVQKSTLISSFFPSITNLILNSTSKNESSLTRLIEIDGKSIKSHVYDTTGLEKFSSLSPSYYREAQGLVVVYDISNRPTFESVEKLLNEFRNCTDKNVAIMLIGNILTETNMDESLRQVTYEEAAEFAKNHGLSFFEISPWDIENVEKAFLSLISDIFQIVSKKQIHKKSVSVIRRIRADHDFRFELVLLGDSEVGKSNILSRFTTNSFNLELKSLIGCEFGTKSIQLDNKDIRAFIWDTNPGERFHSFRSQYYDSISGALLIYDITKYSTFLNIRKWLFELRERVDEDIVIMVVGNKIDLEKAREVSTEEGEEFAHKHQLLFIETSALDSTNVEKAFRSVLTDIYYNILSEEALSTTTKSSLFSKKEIGLKYSLPPKKQQCQVV